MLKLHQNLFLLLIILPLHTQTIKFGVLKAEKTNFGAKLALKFSYAIIIPFAFLFVFLEFLCQIVYFMSN